MLYIVEAKVKAVDIVANSKYSQGAVNKYREKNYWNMSVTVPKEHKEAIQKAAADRGVSVSRLVCDVLGRELGLDLVLDGVLPNLRKTEDGGADPVRPENPKN